MIKEAEGLSPDYNFPNKLEDIAVLQYAVQEYQSGMAAYALGNLYYDRLDWEEAVHYGNGKGAEPGLSDSTP